MTSHEWLALIGAIVMQDFLLFLIVNRCTGRAWERAAIANDVGTYTRGLNGTTEFEWKYRVKQ